VGKVMVCGGELHLLSVNIHNILISNGLLRKIPAKNREKSAFVGHKGHRLWGQRTKVRVYGLPVAAGRPQSVTGRA
jgi:hypothetical protein